MAGYGAGLLKKPFQASVCRSIFRPGHDFCAMLFFKAIHCCLRAITSRKPPMFIFQAEPCAGCARETYRKKQYVTFNFFCFHNRPPSCLMRSQFSTRAQLPSSSSRQPLQCPTKPNIKVMGLSSRPPLPLQGFLIATVRPGVLPWCVGVSSSAVLLVLC